MTTRLIPHNQHGFSLVEGLLVIITVALVSFVGYYVYHAQTTASNTYNGASKVAQASPSPKATVAASQYLIITEWGVRVKMANADKATYNYISPGSPELYYGTESAARLVIKPAALQAKDNCTAQVTMYRESNISDDTSDFKPQKIGAYYYFVTGSPEVCPNAADNALAESLRADFTQSNVREL